MRSFGAALVALLLFGSTAAQAAIRIEDSRYDNGVLIVTGQTGPNQDVTLDSKYKTKSDGGGHFDFHVQHYKPSTCMSDITAGEDSYSAVISGCLSADAAAEDRAFATTTASPTK